MKLWQRWSSELTNMIHMYMSEQKTDKFVEQIVVLKAYNFEQFKNICNLTTVSTHLINNNEMEEAQRRLLQMLMT